MTKPKKEAPTITEVMTGVDMVGTILDIELPKLTSQLNEIRERLDALALPAPPRKPLELAEISNSISELRDIMESQERQIAALDVRLARLAEEPRGADA